jgi:hypothetical protein
VQDVKNKILEKKHASVKTQNIFVIAPTPVYVNFIFSSITPNTLSMQAAIIANLMQFFRSGTDIGTALKEDKYRCAINSTVDTETGDVLQDFNLTSPAGDIPIGTGELAVLGTISFT